MANYRIYNHAQSVLLAINFEEQLQEGTFEYTLHHLVEKYLDLSDFETDYCNDKTGCNLAEADSFCVLQRYYFKRRNRLVL